MVVAREYSALSTRFNTCPPYFKGESKITRDLVAQYSMLTHSGEFSNVNTNCCNKTTLTLFSIIPLFILIFSSYVALMKVQLEFVLVFFFVVFLAFDFCRFCVVIRFFHPRHNGQGPPTLKDFLSQILSITFILLSYFLRKSLLNVQC